MLTTKEIEKAIRAGKNVILTDDAPRGGGKLVFRLRGGAAAWLFQYFLRGKRKFIKVGSVESKSLSEARAAIEPLRAILDNGLDPQAELEREAREKSEQERQQRAMGSVESMFADYVRHLKDQGKSSWPEVQRALLSGKYPAADTLGRDTKAKDVSVGDVASLLRETAARGEVMAARLRAYLSAAFNLALTVEHDWRVKNPSGVVYGLESNPVAATPRGGQNVGKRALSVEELGQVWRELPTKTSFLLGNCFKLIIAVGGARPLEVLHSKWDEFDLDDKVWHLPGERTKNSRDHDLPLSKRALEVLRELKAKSCSEYLFPSAHDAGKPAPIASLAKAVTRFCNSGERDGRRMDHWTPRDLRRTVRTRLGDVGVSGHVMDCFLNHGLTASVGGKHYDRSQHMAEKTRALAMWDSILDRALGQAEASKVINISR